MAILENVCPVCHHKNEVEAVVCGNCGAALEDLFMDPGAKTKTTDMHAVGPETIQDWSIDRAAIPERGIAVYVEGAFQPAYVDSKGEFVIGRKVVDSASDVSFDLSAQGGYHLGISRRLAVIQR